MDKKIYRQFARVLVEVGANLQPGETAVIQAPPDQYLLVREIAQVCYQMGARYVKAEYEDDALGLIRAEYAKAENLSGYPQWLADYRKAYGEDNICVISLSAPCFDAIPPSLSQKLREVQEGERRCGEGFTEAISDGTVSLVKTVVPNLSWAKAVYPGLDGEEALAKLWESFLRICRLDQEDPVKAWRKHQKNLADKKKILNGLGLKMLHLKGGQTDLKVGLVRGGRWIGGCAYNQKNGLEYVPNIPTEEIFFVPDKYQVNGRVASTVPLNYKGSLIEEIVLDVENGKVTGHSAAQGEELLSSILETDEGSCYFGEVSLVSVRSPIYRTGTVFYNTLLDENAVCHMALGKGTPGILENGYELSRKDQEAAGINFSKIHVDFMIGSPELDVDGLTETGENIAIFRAGDWVI